MTNLSRRRFLKSAAYGAAGAGVLGTVAAALADDGTLYALQGLDVSHWQGTIDWASVKSSGKKFTFCKATEGTDFIDSRFASNWAGMRTVGILRGAYHFGRPGVDAVEQADHFCNVIQPKPGDLRPVLDLEATDGMTPAQVRNWVVAFVNRMVVRTGLPPIIYTGFFFWRDSAGNGSSLGCPLWLAYWGTGNPQTFVPAAWTTFSFWQYTSTGSCPGVSGNVDRDACNLSKTGLNNLRLP